MYIENTNHSHNLNPLCIPKKKKDTYPATMIVCGWCGSPVHIVLTRRVTKYKSII